MAQTQQSPTLGQAEPNSNPRSLPPRQVGALEVPKDGEKTGRGRSGQPIRSQDQQE